MPREGRERLHGQPAGIARWSVIEDRSRSVKKIGKKPYIYSTNLQSEQLILCSIRKQLCSRAFDHVYHTGWFNCFHSARFSSDGSWFLFPVSRTIATSTACCTYIVPSLTNEACNDFLFSSFFKQMLHACMLSSEFTRLIRKCIPAPLRLPTTLHVYGSTSSTSTYTPSRLN